MDCPADTTWVVNIASVRANHRGCTTRATGSTFRCDTHAVGYLTDEHGRWVVAPANRKYSVWPVGAA